MKVRCRHDLFPVVGEKIVAGTEGDVTGRSGAHQPVSLTCAFLRDNGQTYTVDLPLDVLTFPVGGFMDVVNLFFAGTVLLSAEWGDVTEDFEAFSLSMALRRTRSFRLKFANEMNLLVTSDRNSGGLLFELETA